MIDLAEMKRRLARPRPGRVILFTGAGFSNGATNSLNKELPLSRHFAEDLAREIGEEAELPLTLVSELYNEKKKDDLALLNVLKATFTVKDVPNAQREILQYPWKRIYTTNYDDLAEHVLGPDGTRPETYSRNTLPLSLEGKRRQIIHINGYVGEIDRSSLVDDFSLTLSSYLDKNLFASTWATTIRQDFELSDLIVFIGYSMYDTDISNILGKNPSLCEKTVAIQPSNLKTADERFLSRFGSVLTIGNDGFARVVSEVLKNGLPKVTVVGPENFEEFSFPSNPPTLAVNDLEVDALLGRGIFNRELLISSRLKKSREYLAARSDAKKIADAMSAAGKQTIVHSEVGNGKTLLLEHVMYELVKIGIRPFLFQRKTDNFAFDIEYFSTLEEPYALLIEEMIANEDVIESLRGQLTNARILTTSRSSAFQVKFSEIRHLFPPDVQVIDVNKLGDEDVGSLIKILNTGAYWSKFPEVRTEKSKRNIVERNCRKELSSVLLGVVQSQALDGRIRSLFKEPSRHNSNARGVIILALCLNVVEMRPTFEFLSELLGRDIFSIMSSFDDEYVRQFFAISGIEVLARSPIMSSYILKNFITDDEVVDVVVGALKESSGRYRRARRYRELNRKFLQFSFIEQLISSDNNKYIRIQDYYDRAGDVGYKEFSPHYWLQYAIAARAFKDYKSADRYFSESKKIASRRTDFYTYQIDNAYAQFLLESRADTDYWSDFFDAFVDASTLAMQQTYIKKAGFYPYRIVGNFERFLEVRLGQFAKKQKEEAKDICRSWLLRIDALPDGLRRNQIVKRARIVVSDSYDMISEVLMG